MSIGLDTYLLACDADDDEEFGHGGRILQSFLDEVEYNTFDVMRRLGNVSKYITLFRHDSGCL